MSIKLVFDDWKNKRGCSAYLTAAGAELSSGGLHSGTTFTPDSLPREEIEAASAVGFYPVFRVVFEEDDR